jgi:hypothetical protein
MSEDVDQGANSEIWVQDLADRNLFTNRSLGLKLPESALSDRRNPVIKIMYDRERERALPPGYIWQADGQIAIDPVAAHAVRRVFELRASGLSPERIAKKLDGTLTSQGQTVWHPANIRAILDSEDTYRSGILDDDSSLLLPPILT